MIEKFGLDRGRLISCLPTKWLREVADAVEASDFTELQRMKVDEKLRWAKKHAVSVYGRPLKDAIGDWNANTISAQEAGHVKDVVASEFPTNHTGVIKFSELTDDHVSFGAPTSWEVPRTTEGIISALAPFLKECRTILIVDPYFHGGMGGPNYADPIGSILDTISQYGVGRVKCQVHFKTINKNPDLNDYETDANRLFSRRIPAELSLELFEWTENVTGIQFHDRHPLTERDGITLGAGFCAVSNAPNLGVTLMSVKDATRKARRFLPGSSSYDPAGRGLRINSDGTTSRI